MAKKIGIRFENIKGVLDLGKDSPVSEVETIDKSVINKIQDAGHQVVIYADSHGILREGEKEEPDFQKSFIKSIVEQKLKDKNIPYDSVQYDNSGLDIDLNYDVLKYKNWEGVLLSALKSTK